MSCIYNTFDKQTGLFCRVVYDWYSNHHQQTFSDMSALSPSCFLNNSPTFFSETAFAYLVTAMPFFLVIPSLAFKTPIAFSQERGDGCDDIKMIVVMIPTDLFFSSRSFIHNGSEVIRGKDYDLVVLDDLLERSYFGQPTETFWNASLLMQLFGQDALPFTSLTNRVSVGMFLLASHVYNQSTGKAQQILISNSYDAFLVSRNLDNLNP